MGIQAERFKKKWRPHGDGGHTSNEESDEKSPKTSYATFGENMML
jgi:hypothetical protein